jgi:hypothetical protein
MQYSIVLSVAVSSCSVASFIHPLILLLSELVTLLVYEMEVVLELKYS